MLLTWLKKKNSTFAEDLMPLIIANETIAQAASKQPVMIGLNSPESSIEFVILRAFRNQKYDVGELLAHSFTVQTRTLMLRF